MSKLVLKSIKGQWKDELLDQPKLHLSGAALEKAKPHGAASLKPPKKWMKQKIKEIGKRGDVDDPAAVAGHIWYNLMSPKKRSSKRKAEGKKYGAAPIKKSVEEIPEAVAVVTEKDEVKIVQDPTQEVKQEQTVEKSWSEQFTGTEWESQAQDLQAQIIAVGTVAKGLLAAQKELEKELSLKKSVA